MTDIHIDQVTINQSNDSSKLDLIISLLTNLGVKMSDITNVIDQLEAALTENTDAVSAAEHSFTILTDEVQKLLAAAAVAPSLEETNALIAEAQAAVSAIKDNSARLIAATLVNAEVPVA